MALFAGGKDSVYAVQKSLREGNMDLLVSVHSPDGSTQLHAGPESSKEIREAQLMAIGLPYLQLEVGFGEEYLHELFIALKEIVDREGIKHLVTGDLWHPYTNGIGDMLSGALDVKLIRPGKAKCPSKGYSVKYMEDVLKEGIEGLVISAREELPKELVGRKIDDQFIDELVSRGLDVAGESGEYQSLVTFAPIMQKRIILDNYGIELVNGKNGRERFHRMNITSFHIENA